MKRFFTLIDKLLNLCNSYLKLFSEVRKRINSKSTGNRIILLWVRRRKNVRSFQIIIVERRSEDHGKKTSNEF